jgi:hypothetical protein
MPGPLIGALGTLGGAAIRGAGKLLMNPYVGAASVGATLLGVDPMDLAEGAETAPDALETEGAIEQGHDLAEAPKIDIERVGSSGHVRISIPAGVDAGELEAALAQFTSPLVTKYKGKEQKLYTLTTREYERLRGGM